jgi:hypothetical protein
LFQVSRIDCPLLIESTYDELGAKIKKELKTIKYVSLIQKDWEKTIYLTQISKSIDTVVVELQCEDTGIIYDHYFVLRKNQWFLYKIRDLSD